MFTFQAIHNRSCRHVVNLSNVKELLSMFTFQAIHNSTLLNIYNKQMSKSYYQCLLFKQFTTAFSVSLVFSQCQRAIINVYFSSNSQPPRRSGRRSGNVKELLSMSTFQAIHNFRSCRHSSPGMSKSYYQCLLFKQFTTVVHPVVEGLLMSKSYYQCLLFKQFTTRRTTRPLRELMSKSYYQCLLFILQRYAYYFNPHHICG